MRNAEQALLLLRADADRDFRIFPLSSSFALMLLVILDYHGCPGSQSRPAQLRMRVQKVGRTTGLTSGRITGVNGAVHLSYASGVTLFTG